MSKLEELKPSAAVRGILPDALVTVVSVQSSLEAGGEGAAAELLAKLGGKAAIARELAYRLYTLCERKKREPQALSYNGLVQSWPEITRLARETGRPPAD